MATNWFTLASGNSHKGEEFNELFDLDLMGIRSANEKIEVDESGASFTENALIKAKAYYSKYNSPVMSDDSGLVVNALPDELGIRSARFGGDNLSDAQRTQLLLTKMNESEDRSAYFTCILCFYLNPDEVFFFEGHCSGSIVKEFRGEYGFGYDPVFLPDGQEKTFAQDTVWKKSHGHRSKAVAQAHKFFSGFFIDN